MQETGVQSLGGEDPLENEITTHASILAWESHGQRSLVGTVHGISKSRTQLSNDHMFTSKIGHPCLEASALWVWRAPQALALSLGRRPEQQREGDGEPAAREQGPRSLGQERSGKRVQTSSSSMRAGSISRLLAWSNDTPC